MFWCSILKRKVNAMNTTTRISLSALLVLALTACNLFGQNPPKFDNFVWPVIDVQNPKENFLGTDNLTYSQKVDPNHYKAGDSVRASWYGSGLENPASVVPVATDRSFTLNFTLDKINTTDFGFKTWTASKTQLKAYTVEYDSTTQNIAWIDGDVHKNQNRQMKYNMIMYALEDATLVEQVNDNPAFTGGVR